MKVSLILLPAALVLASCRTPGGNPGRFAAVVGVRYHQASSPGQDIPAVTRANVQDNIPYLSGDGVSGEPFIKICQVQQKAFFLQE